MSTRCRIGVQLPNGTVRSIYCHHDGYLEGVGRTLQQHYKDKKKVEALVKLGDISSLSDTVEETAPDSYHRRGEDTPCREDESFYDFWRNAFSCGEEFAYLLGESFDGIYEWQVKEETYPHTLDERLAELNN